MIDINNILKQQYNLTPFGIEGPRTVSGPDKFSEDDLNQIQTAVDWLKTKKIQKTMNRKVHSYSIKHIIERERNTYVSNGCLIAAVIHLGIPYERIGESPNIHVAIGTRELYGK